MVTFRNGVRRLHMAPREAALARATEGARGCECSSEKRSEEAELAAAAARPTVNYSQLSSDQPHRPTRTKFSRLGSELQLDLHKVCPTGSLMLERKSDFVPDHLDCPTVFIIGARKAGTSSLYMYLSKHPRFKGVLLDKGPQVGETFYFSSRWSKWQWHHYMKVFEHTTRYMTGESSVGNLVNCHAPERLWQSCGKQARVVILLRDPVKRLESNFLMRVRLKSRDYNNNTRASTVVQLELESFISTALSTGGDLKQIEQSWEKFRCLFNPSQNLIFEGVYYIHLMNWLCNFPPENILVLSSEEFFANAQAVYEDVVSFLGLPLLDQNTTEFITATAYNQGRGDEKSHQKLSEMDKKQLKAVYKNTNRPLLQLLGWEGLKWI